MNDAILKNIDERLAQSWRMSSYIETDDSPLEALRFAVERLGQIKKHWGVICGESRPNSLKSPMTVILEDAEKEISEILGINK